VRGLLPALALLRRADVVHVNTTVLPSWLLLARLTGRRVVCHVHEAEWPGPAPLHRLLLRPLLAADTVVANSRFTAEVVTGLLPALRGRTTVVPNPVPGPPAATPARERLDGPVRLVFVGRLSPRKGADVAVEVLRELLARGVDARLTLAGSVFPGYEWFEARLRDTVRDAGAADRVTLAGFVPDVWPVLGQADVVLVPSVLDESFGNTAVEAVLAARPAVVSDLRGLREATEGCTAVRVAAPGLAGQWADAVEEIVTGWPQVREAAARDAAVARDRHAPGRFAARLADAVGLSGTSGVPTAPRSLR
jgi:glycosyltransferase involved in cell wall biosynthesis